MPFQTGLFPFLEPFELRTRFYEELHFHLFELTHTEDELAGHDFVTERLTNLCDTERHLHTAGLLYVQVVHEDTLSGFRTEVYLHGTFRSRPHFRREHQVELTDFGPVLGTRNRADNFFVQDDLTEFVQVRTGVHGFRVAFVQRVTLSLVFQYTGVGATELSLVEGVAEFLGGLGYFLIDFFVVLGNLVFNQYVGTVAFLRVTVVNQRVVERVYVSGSLPDGRVHEDSRVDAYDVLVQEHHALPPVLFDIVFQFHTHLSVIVYGTQSVIDFT